jgi:IS605 OrfB family transposase
MPTLSYCKGLPTAVEEMTALGFTSLEMFLSEFSSIFHAAASVTVNHLLSATEPFNKSAWNTHLQQTYGISKRHANGVISHSKGLVDSTRECSKHHVKTLRGKFKSIQKWIDSAERKLKNARKFYRKRNWINSKTGCVFPLSCSLKFRDTNWQNLRFQLHNKKRRRYQLTKQIEHLSVAPIKVKVPRHQVLIVGSKDETCGNQACQWDGETIHIRVPSCLESKFGKYATSKIGNFDRTVNRLPEAGAKTWHFYRKNGRWCVAVQFTPAPVTQISRPRDYGCIGIDMNPGSIGWAYCDKDGNLQKKGKIPLLMGLLKGKQDAQTVAACLQLSGLAKAYACPVVCEELDFSDKKEQLSERGRKYARMLSSWAYSRFKQLLSSILSNRGIELILVNPAYTSVIGLVKYVRMYGLASDEAAGLAIARRGMNYEERLPSAINAYLEVNSLKHGWHWWSKVNTLLKQSGVNRHTFYSISNGESLVNRLSAEAACSA